MAPGPRSLSAPRRLGCGALLREERATSGTSRSTTSRPSASLITSGGSRRTTLSAVTLMSRPASERLLHQLAAGPVELDADHQALAADLAPRRHAAERRARARRGSQSPMRSAFSSRPSSSIMSSVVSAAAQRAGCRRRSSRGCRA